MPLRLETKATVLPSGDRVGEPLEPMRAISAIVRPRSSLDATEGALHIVTNNNALKTTPGDRILCADPDVIDFMGNVFLEGKLTNNWRLDPAILLDPAESREVNRPEGFLLYCAHAEKS